MPDIEMHGPWENTSYQGESSVKRAIQATFTDAPYRNDITLISADSWCQQIDGMTPAPFLRVWICDLSLLDDILKRLKTLGLDIEVAHLHRFISRLV